MTPQLHAGLLGASALACLVLAHLILARNPGSVSARMHSVYGGLLAWWFFSMAMVAAAGSREQIEFWSRLLHLSIGMLPAVGFHLNVAAAGAQRQYGRTIRWSYGVAGAATLLCTTALPLFSQPRVYGWGPYPAYTVWGALPVGMLVLMLIGVTAMYRRAIRLAEPGTARRAKHRALMRGNFFAFLAMIDFLPAFGLEVYPFGYLIMPTMLAATLFGSVRYQLIEITPEFAAEQILHTLPDGVLLVDHVGVIRLANEGASRLLGHPAEELLERPLSEVGSDALAAIDPLEDQDWTLTETAILSAEGRARLIALSRAVLRDQVGKPVGCLVVLRDITAQRQVEAEKDELEGWIRHSQKLETLGVMAGGIAHDFNNLLAIILGNAEIAGHRLESGRSAEAELGEIVTAAQRGSEITHQMLRFAGEGTTRMAPVDLNELCNEAARLLRSAISKKARLALDLAEGLPNVLADSGNLHQVILNLVNNASDALGGESGSITVRTGLLEEAGEHDAALDDGPRVLLEVSDTGVGMDAETKERAFDPFFTTKLKGRGLGLANVMGIVRSHGGWIRLETEPSQGTRFTIALPAATATQAGAPQREALAAAPLAGGLALVADDEPGVRNLVRLVLEEAGFEVLEATHGASAVEVVRARGADLAVIVLDVAMPEMDGKEALAEIRRLTPKLPVILMSGHVEASLEDVAHDGPTTILAKPFRTSELTRLVRQATSPD